MAYARYELPKVQAFKWLSYSYRYYNDESVQKFQEWVVPQEWLPVINASGSQEKAVQYQKLVNGAIESCFPLITVRRKSTDPPWVNARLRKLMRKQKAIYKAQGRSMEWRKVRQKISRVLRERREKYEKSQKIKLLADDGERHFFKNVRNYQSKERAAPFDVKNLFPGLTERQVADKLAVHFNSISNEFKPLESWEIPVTYSKPLPLLQAFQVSGRIKKFRKPCLLYTSPSPRD